MEGRVAGEWVTTIVCTWPNVLVMFLIPNMHNFFVAHASETEKSPHGARSIHDVCVVYMCCPGPLLPSSTRTIYSYRNTTQKETSLLGQSDGGQPRGPTDGSIAREWVSYMTRNISPGNPLQRLLYIYTPIIRITKTKKWPSMLVKLTSLIACHSAGRRPRGPTRVSVLGPPRACGPKMHVKLFLQRTCDQRSLVLKIEKNR